MKLLTRVAAWIGLACLLVACNTTDARFLRDGVGTDLYTPDSADSAHGEDLYVGFLCRRAGLASPRSELCTPDPISAGQWSAVAQAGLNDIDQRCDAYLGWLDAKRRNIAPGLQQIGDMSTAVDAFLVATGAGVQPLALAAAAFGIARNTFSNFSSRLILEVNHSTVQAIVLSRQNAYRRELLTRRIDNRPAAIHALRNYLRICMPFTIETEINTTITAFERGGPDALSFRRSLAGPDTVGVSWRGPPVQAGAALSRPAFPPDGRAVASFASLFDASVPAVPSRDQLGRIQSALCVPAEERSAPGEKTRALIRIYEASDETDSPADGRLGTRDIAVLLASGSCARDGGKNYFERRTYGDDASELVSYLNHSDRGYTLEPGTKLGDASLRRKVMAVRGDPRLRLGLAVPASMSDQVTPDLVAGLRALPAR